MAMKPGEFRKIEESTEWKDHLAGWARWEIAVPECQECGKKNTSMKLYGTEEDAKKFAGTINLHFCGKCE